MLPIKRNSKSTRSKSKKVKVESLLGANPFDARVDYTAFETVEALAKLDSDNARVQLEFAKCLVMSGSKLAICKKQFEKAIALENNAEFYFEFAETLRENKNKGHAAFYNQAYRMDSQNPDYICGLARVKLALGVWSQRSAIEQLGRRALKIDPSHPIANFFVALSGSGTFWRSGLLEYADKIQNAFEHAKLGLKGTTNLSNEEEAQMHDILACVYAKEKRFRLARVHYDCALELYPLEGIRNYWKFLQNNNLDPQLVKIAQHLTNNFNLSSQITVANLFDRFSTLTQGYRALLAKNNRNTYMFLREYAQRERQWMLLIHPFNDEFFPTVVTMAILDFLFYV